MPSYIQKRPKLLIVSDTALWNLPEGGFVAFEPVVREIEHFQALFSSITWIGYEQPGVPVGNARGTEVNLDVVFLPQVGGSRFLDKLKILPRIPVYGWKVFKEILKADVVHTRAPSLPAFMAILFSLLDRKRIYWHKYAGTWQDRAPWFYELQRWFLKRARRARVTINGTWPGQQVHLLNFENPCLSEQELEEAKTEALRKDFSTPRILCFVGNLTLAKGVLPLVEGFEKWCQKNPSKIFELHIAGDGILRPEMERFAKKRTGIIMYGFLQREGLKEIYKKAHFLILPSKSEGFPKVVAEASAFGCIPVVSDVSSVGQYIYSGENGFLLKGVTSEDIFQMFEKILGENMDLKLVSINALKMAALFTYERYRRKIEEKILKV